MSRAGVPGLVLLLALVASTAAAAENEPRDLYERATNWFANVRLFKPAEPTNSNLVAQLAPLILQETRAASPAAALAGTTATPPSVTPSLPAPPPDRFGSLVFSNGTPALNLAHPALYTWLDLAQINGRPHPQVSYVWAYPSHVDASVAVDLQGIRLTLNTAGEPVIWEVLSRAGATRLIFVAESLESAAQAQFGKPHAGRRFAVERALEETPAAVVPRVLSDGPVPMGPIVYLQADTRSVTTMICRCMPAQAKHVASSTTYELVSPPRDWLDRLWSLSAGNPTFRPGDDPEGAQLGRALRLPANF